jgi:hypothetical protein
MLVERHQEGRSDDGWSKLMGLAKLLALGCFEESQY